MLRLVNTRRLMGDYVNSLPYNILASLTVISVSLISLVYLGMFIWGMSHG
jgi:Mn2+/Fe2+ NRAMP family transporter